MLKEKKEQEDGKRERKAKENPRVFGHVVHLFFLLVA